MSDDGSSDEVRLATVLATTVSTADEREEVSQAHDLARHMFGAVVTLGATSPELIAPVGPSPSGLPCGR